MKTYGEGDEKLTDIAIDLMKVVVRTTVRTNLVIMNYCFNSMYPFLRK